MDFLSIVGVILGFAAIIGGNYLGGTIAALVNVPAAIIVVGSTWVPLCCKPLGRV